VKVRCPYCRQVFPPQDRNRCPDCRKTVLLPGFFGESARTSARETAGRARERARRQAPPRLPFLGRPGRLIIVLVVMLAVGLLLVRRVRVGPPPTDTHKRNLATRNIRTLGLALDCLRRDCGRYPTTREGLASLIHNPGLDEWRGPYIFELKPDPWGCAFMYEQNDGAVAIASRGPDGAAGSADDILLDQPATGREQGVYPVNL